MSNGCACTNISAKGINTINKYKMCIAEGPDKRGLVLGALNKFKRTSVPLSL